MGFNPHRFGRYTIVDPIAVGGMAEIYRARITNNTEGADRIIVIKKVIANLSKNEEFLQMFEEEIKITVGLTHPNIIQIYDYGKVDDQYFMAMEYVEGKNLRQFVKRLADMKSMFSIDMSCHIIVQTCQALGFAHNFRDRLSGKSLGIVHRDISPQNVMISYDGAVKLFDFGIAKAKSANESTQAGVIKGKPSYLSPEQINGEELDGRSDIFALGIVLWELLTAKRLFVSDSDMGVLRMIQSAKIEPPSTFNPAVPQQLDAIVLKALSRDKTKRYQTAEEFQRDLNKFLYSFNPNFNPADLSYYAQELFKNEIKEDRERLMKFLAMPVVGTEDNNPAKVEKKKPAGSTKLADGLVSSTDFNRELMEKNLTNAGEGKADFGGTVEIEAPTSGRRGPGAPANVGIKVDRSKLVTPPGSRSGSNMVIPPWTKQSPGSSGSVRPGSRALELDKALKESGRRNSALALAGVFAALLVGGYYTGMFKGTPLEFLYGGNPAMTTADTAPVSPIRNPAGTQSPDLPEVHTPSGLNMGTIILRTNVEEGVAVYVNDNIARVVNNRLTVPLKTDLNIVVSKLGYTPAKFHTIVTDARPASFYVELKKMAVGELNFTTIPESKLTFFAQDGSQFSLNTPVSNREIPAGRYKVVVESFGFNSIEVMIDIESGKLTRKHIDLH